MPKTSRRATSKPKAKKVSPPALVASAQALRQSAQARLRARREGAVEIIRENVQNMGENVLDIGLAAGELMAKGVPEAMGHASFEALCAAEFGDRVHPKTIARWAALAPSLASSASSS